MFTLYCLLILMMIAALAMLLIPFLRNHSLKFKNYFFLAISVVIAAFLLYAYSGNKSALVFWFNQGKEHYQLQEKFDALGGVDGIITKIEAKLENNPRDAQGWFILGKLYFAKHEYKTALTALTNAHELEPQDKEISMYYDRVVEKSKHHKE